MRRQLDMRNIVIHPYVVAELALGSLRERAKTLALLDRLPQAQVAQLSEVRYVVETRSLFSRGICLMDAHLIASCLIHPPTRLWSNDNRLAEIAETLGIAANIS